MTKSQILPSFLAADLGRLAEELRRAEASGADAIHLDIMDPHFVPNMSFGPSLVDFCRRPCPGFHCAGGANSATATGLRDSVWNVSGVTNSQAAGVMTTFTSSPFFTNRRTSSAALYAAIDPVTPKTTFLI